jgi:hypothetical protein
MLRVLDNKVVTVVDVVAWSATTYRGSRVLAYRSYAAVAAPPGDL